MIESTSLKLGLVSTIIPVHNRPAMVRQAIESVLAQTYRPIEIIVVDDGSTDDTPEVLAELQATRPSEIQVLRQANAGAGAARETGRMAARGAFIQYLDSDDLLLPNKFADQVTALEAHPECAISYGTSRHVHVDGRVLEYPSRRTADQIDHLFPLLLLERWWHTHTPLFRRWISDAAGPWPPFRPEDWDLEARMGALRPRLIHCGSTVSVQVAHESTDRVSRGDELSYLCDEARFLPHLHACAVLAGVDPAAAEMQAFSRRCFMRARQLDANGEISLAEQLLALASYGCSASPGVSRVWQIRFYSGVRRLIGGGLCGALADSRQLRWAIDGCSG